MDDEIDRLKSLIANAKHVVFFGGAGVSTESGIPDFRSRDGLYHQKYSYPPEMILSRSFFYAKTKEFYRFYYDKILPCVSAPVSRAHVKLAQMENSGKLRCVITQNIDSLHQKAGSKNVLQLHGSVESNRCVFCGRRFDVSYLLQNAPLPRCGCGGIIKPDIVLYEERLEKRVVETAKEEIRKSDLLIVGGTSLCVYPAAGFVSLRGGKLAVINKDPTPADSCAELFLRRSIGDVFERL